MIINDETVIKNLSYKHEECLSAPLDKIVEFLPNIKMASKTDMSILDTWREHFKHEDIPYIVVKDGELLTIFRYREEGDANKKGK